MGSVAMEGKQGTWHLYSASKTIGRKRSVWEGMLEDDDA